MLAKSTRNLFQVPYTGATRPWARSLLLVAFLMASFATLSLMLRDHYGFALNAEMLAKVLPFGIISPGTGEADPAPATGAEDVTPVAKDPNEGRYRALAEFLAKRYRVSQDVTFDLVSFAHAAGHQLGLDPLLIIAVIAVESRFNPIAESVAGAKGLMQVIPKYHSDKLQEFGGEHAVFDPQTNILVGAQILKEYVGRTGSLSAALQMYAGATQDTEDSYTTKVMTEKQRLQQVVNQSKRTVRVAQASSSPLGE